ncbi:kinase-like domain-containing protein [Rhizophagus irregularis DAOM 181602=DAOM 197198]|uniref:Cdc15p n=3 Tax=Rhizophagus irregularis TaxID=588596 RepID=A0A015JJQ3_RHIIW|nr:kinase-like domain-containing protein [Rhizophagus irregularis DAOM 181602=DAOM 197198]EXX55139.1 Cdc15p [Rhizophagus irregularis DAOM 197198w]POG79157.1 kinase-like domain-containing protein [Rhizophagus irregularis DAOM 181602=DAOM 197198]|eukprot:XP_025186023.1 kinase-like domain-containing protein [Rhizophagus irregularis DAOM 181602=DAOM 197198]
MSNDNKYEIQMESEFNKLNISDRNPNINHENCYKPNDGKLWCKECVPHCIVEGWTSGNNDIDEFIKDTIYNAKLKYCDDGKKYPSFLEWVPFDKFVEIKQIGEGGFSKVYSAIWIDNKVKYIRQNDGSWKKGESAKPIKVALKKLNDSQNISVEYLNEIKTLWNIYFNETTYLKFYGITKDIKTKEFMMIIQLANKGSLRCILSSNFDHIFWNEKLKFLYDMVYDLKNLHKLGYCHKDFHSGNMLQNCNKFLNSVTYISDFGLSGPSNQRSNNKICGVLPYIAPEVLNGEPYTLSSDIYSFGIIMTELSSGKPPFYNRKHDISLSLEICNGVRPEFGKGTPEIYKKLAYRCMSAVPNQRPTADELYDALKFWYHPSGEDERDKFGYKGKKIKAIFNEADNEILNISTSYEKNPDAIYTSRVFTFSNLPKPVNSPIVTSYLNDDDEENKDCQDSKLFDLEVPN